MIIEEIINGLVFQEQRTYYIYKSEEDRNKGNSTLCTSSESTFNTNKELAKINELENKENTFIINI